MARKIRPVAHDDRLSLVEHLEELRSRLMVALLAFGIAFAVCFWQDERLISFVNKPLPDGNEPLTLSPTEPLLTTMTIAGYGAILIAMPVVLYQIYSFVLPAFSPTERKVALPLLLMVPFLFVGGAAFGYFVVMEPALKFLLNFNSSEFQTEVRARDYYSFVSLSLLSIGILFQIPVGVLGLTKLGITTPEKLRHNRRYAILGCAVLAALLPTIDPVTMLIEMVPLVVLYEVSILLAVAWGRPSTEVAERLASAEGSS
ncbi:MAG TPA: twin-arginine translocase subunit TatC [Thermoleophilaceae bacterium]